MCLSFSFPPLQNPELADGRVHYAGRFIGEEAQLPCVVNFDECGQIYFLTWSKNVSNEWQRVYLYSESYQTALGDLAVGDGSRVTLDASNMSSLGLAFLKIRSVSIEDEATYKCDVTYVHGTCPSLTYTRLFALGKWVQLLFPASCPHPPASFCAHHEFFPSVFLCIKL